MGRLFRTLAARGRGHSGPATVRVDRVGGGGGGVWGYVGWCGGGCGGAVVCGEVVSWACGEGGVLFALLFALLFFFFFFFGRCVNANATSGGAAGAWRGFVFLWCGVCVFCLDDDLQRKEKEC